MNAREFFFGYRDHFMRKTPFRKSRYLQLPSRKCQTPPNLKVIRGKEKKYCALQGFEPRPPDPKSAILSTIPWLLTWIELMITKNLKCYKSNFQIWWSLALSGGKLQISWFLKRSFSHDMISNRCSTATLMFIIVP